MSSRDELAKVIANDPRYSLEAYAFVLESLNQARQLKLKSAPRAKADDAAKPPAAAQSRAEASDKPRISGHVDAAQLCDARAKTRASPVRVLVCDCARPLGSPVHLRRRRHRLQPDCRRRPGKDRERLSL